MSLVWIDNKNFTLTSKLEATANVLPVSSSDAAALCAKLGDSGHTYLTLSSPTAVEVVKATCSNGLIAIERGQNGTTASTFASGRCATFKVNQAVLDEYLQEALTGGCTPTVEIAEDSSDYLEVTEPDEDNCNWVIGLKSDFIDQLTECCFEDEFSPCVLPDGTYENATLTVINGKVCGVSNGTNIVYTGGSCCGCENCQSE